MINYEVTIMEKIPGGYDTWQRGIMTGSYVLNQFDRCGKRGLRPLFSEFVQSDRELLEWERKPGRFVVFVKTERSTTVFMKGVGMVARG